MGKTFFWKGVLVGAIAGGALTLFDKATRQTVVENCKKTTDEISYFVKNPGEAVSQVKDVATKIKSTVEQVSSDISFITEKVEELQEGTTDLVELVGDTKDAFLEDDQDESYKEWSPENTTQG